MNGSSHLVSCRSCVLYLLSCIVYLAIYMYTIAQSLMLTSYAQRQHPSYVHEAASSMCTGIDHCVVPNCAHAVASMLCLSHPSAQSNDALCVPGGIASLGTAMLVPSISTHLRLSRSFFQRAYV